MDWLKPAIFLCVVFWLLGIWMQLSEPARNRDIDTLLLIPQISLVVLVAILVARWIKRSWPTLRAPSVKMKLPSLSLSHQPKDFPVDRWTALVKYDPEIAAAAEQLRPYGERWIQVLGRDYFALQEDRKYLPHMVRRLIEDAQSAAKQGNNQFQNTSA